MKLLFDAIYDNSREKHRNGEEQFIVGENEADDEVTNGACLFSFPNEMAIKGSC